MLLKKLILIEGTCNKWINVDKATYDAETNNNKKKKVLDGSKIKYQICKDWVDDNKPVVKPKQDQKKEEPKKPEEKTATQPDPTMKDPTDYNIDVTPKKEVPQNEVPSGTEIKTPQTPPNNVQSGIPKRGRVIKLIHPNDW